jgi:hypothetical protein
LNNEKFDNYFSILVCYKTIKLDDGIFSCHLQHKRCSHCPPSGCILCKFNGLRSWVNSTLDDLPPDIQYIVTTCDALEKQFESIQPMNSNYDRQDSTAMDVDYNPVSIQSKFL